MLDPHRVAECLGPFKAQGLGSRAQGVGGRVLGVGHMQGGVTVLVVAADVHLEDHHVPPPPETSFRVEGLGFGAQGLGRLSTQTGGEKGEVFFLT